jgi:hypothetical protein
MQHLHGLFSLVWRWLVAFVSKLKSFLTPRQLKRSRRSRRITFDGVAKRFSYESRHDDEYWPPRRKP